MFTGFPREAVDFLYDLRVHNNQAFYEANRERYETLVKAPLRALCEEMAPVVQVIDPRLDTRPGSVMSRLRRDTRFTRDKSPFRDHVWLGWRYPGERRSEGFHMYWGFGPDWLGWGCGSYGPDKPLMDALRAEIRRNPEPVREAIACLEPGKRYIITGEPFKKLAVPKDVPEDLKGLYVLKYFGAESVAEPEAWDALWSHAIADRLAEELSRMTPLLRLTAELRAKGAPEEAAPAAKDAPQSSSGPTLHRARTAEEFEF